jgi:hypothetical protein
VGHHAAKRPSGRPRGPSRLRAQDDEKPRDNLFNEEERASEKARIRCSRCGPSSFGIRGGRRSLPLSASRPQRSMRRFQRFRLRSRCRVRRRTPWPGGSGADNVASRAAPQPQRHLLDADAEPPDWRQSRRMGSLAIDHHSSGNAIPSSPTSSRVALGRPRGRPEGLPLTPCGRRANDDPPHCSVAVLSSAHVWDFRVYPFASSRRQRSSVRELRAGMRRSRRRGRQARRHELREAARARRDAAPSRARSALRTEARAVCRALRRLRQPRDREG